MLYSDNLFTYYEIIKVQFNIWISFICLIQNSQFDISIVCNVTCETLVAPLKLSQNVPRQFHVTGSAVLALTKI